MKILPLTLIATFIILTSGNSFARNPSTPGPQPYLLFNVLMPKHGIVVGTVSAHTDFDFSFQSRDGSDFVGMHARLISKNSSGFRISWFVVQRAQHKEVARIEERVFVPWAASESAKRLKSIPGYYVSVFYSDAPANEHSNATSA